MSVQPPSVPADDKSEGSRGPRSATPGLVTDIIVGIITLLVLLGWLYLMIIAKRHEPALDGLLGVLVGYFVGTNVTIRRLRG